MDIYMLLVWFCLQTVWITILSYVKNLYKILVTCMLSFLVWIWNNQFCLCESCSNLLLQCYLVLCCFVYVNHAQICCWNVILFYVVLSMWILLKSVVGMLCYSMLFCLCESCSNLLLECYVILCCFVYVNHAKICCWNVMLFYVVLSMLFWNWQIPVPVIGHFLG